MRPEPRPELRRVSVGVVGVLSGGGGGGGIDVWVAVATALLEPTTASGCVIM
jgi:hypothetical protein